MSTLLNDTQKRTFQAIKKFVLELDSVLNTKECCLSKPIHLYSHLLQRTKLSNTKSVLRHNVAFTSWILQNKEAVLKQERDNLVSMIVYTPEKIYIDVKTVLTMMNNSTRNVVWNHLLAISSLIYPDMGAREVLLKRTRVEKKDPAKYLDSLRGEIESTVGSTDCTSPMQAIASMMMGGKLQPLFDQLNQDVDSGAVDINSLLQNLQGMMADIQQTPATTKPTLEVIQEDEDEEKSVNDS